MTVLRIYLANEQDKNSDDYLYGLQSNKLFLMLQCFALVALSIIAYILSGFYFIMVIFIIFAIYNCAYIYLTVKKADLELEKKSPKFQVKWYSDLFFYLIKEFDSKMKSQNAKKNEISNWEMRYLNDLKSDLSLRNFKEVTLKVQKHIEKLDNTEYELNEPDFLKFRKKDAKSIRNKLFPELDGLIEEDKISLKAKGVAKSANTVVNDGLSKNLQLLGLSPNTKNMKVIDARYRQLVVMYHPDHSKEPDATQKLREVNVAYNDIKRFFSSKK